MVLKKGWLTWNPHPSHTSTIIGVSVWFWEEQVKDSLFIQQISVGNLLRVQVLPYDWEDSSVQRKGSFSRKRWKVCLIFPPDFLERLSLKHRAKATLSRNSHKFFWDQRSWGLTCFSLGFQTRGPQISCCNILPFQISPSGIPCHGTGISYPHSLEF